MNAIAASLHIPHLYEVVVFLMAAVVIVPLFQRMHASPVLGFLFAGVLIGPHGLRIIRDVEGVSALAELGVIFLLFTIGLELSLDRLKAMKRLVFGLGTLQVVATGAVICAVLLAFGFPLPAAAIIGSSAALSSTAVIIQLLMERGEFATRHGRTTFAVLLFQDLAVVPILVLITILGHREQSVAMSLAMAAAKTIGAVGLIVVAGRWILRPMYRVVAATRSPEILMATTLLAILVIASITGVAGLSMALGAFLAGLLLADTPYRHQIELDIQPFKGLLLGLFFISVGMQIDTGAMLARPFVIVAAVLGLIVIKAGVLGGLARAFGLPRGAAIRLAMTMAGGGEFAFVAGGIAVASHVVAPDAGQLLLIVASLSMAVTPLLSAIAMPVERYLDQRSAVSEQRELDAAAHATNHVVIIGFGWVGQLVAHTLAECNVSYVALDTNAKRVGTLHRKGIPIWFGDGTRSDVLRKAGIDTAALALITFIDPRLSAKVCETIRAHSKTLPVFARARDTNHARELEGLGATMIVPEALEASLQLSAHALAVIGTPRNAVELSLDTVRLAHYAGTLHLSEDTLAAEPVGAAPARPGVMSRIAARHDVAQPGVVCAARVMCAARRVVRGPA